METPVPVMSGITDIEQLFKLPWQTVLAVCRKGGVHTSATVGHINLRGLLTAEEWQQCVPAEGGAGLTRKMRSNVDAAMERRGGTSTLPPPPPPAGTHVDPTPAQVPSSSSVGPTSIVVAAPDLDPAPIVKDVGTRHALPTTAMTTSSGVPAMHAPVTTAAQETTTSYVYHFSPSSFVAHEFFKCPIRLRRQHLRMIGTETSAAPPCGDATRRQTATNALRTTRGDLFETAVMKHLNDELHELVPYGHDYVKDPTTTSAEEKRCLSRLTDERLVELLLAAIGLPPPQDGEHGGSSTAGGKRYLAQVCLPVVPSLAAQWAEALNATSSTPPLELKFSRCFPDLIAVQWTRRPPTQVAAGGQPSHRWTCNLRVIDCKSSARPKRGHKLQVAFYVVALQAMLAKSERIRGRGATDQFDLHIDDALGEIWTPSDAAAQSRGGCGSIFQVHAFEVPKEVEVTQFFAVELKDALQGLPTARETANSRVDPNLKDIEQCWLRDENVCLSCEHLVPCKARGVLHMAALRDNSLEINQLLDKKLPRVTNGDVSARLLRNGAAVTRTFDDYINHALRGSACVVPRNSNAPPSPLCMVPLPLQKVCLLTVLVAAKQDKPRAGKGDVALERCVVGTQTIKGRDCVERGIETFDSMDGLIGFLRVKVFAPKNIQNPVFAFWDKAQLDLFHSLLLYGAAPDSCTYAAHLEETFAHLNLGAVNTDPLLHNVLLVKGIMEATLDLPMPKPLSFVEALTTDIQSLAGEEAGPLLQPLATGVDTVTTVTSPQDAALAANSREVMFRFADVARAAIVCGRASGLGIRMDATTVSETTPLCSVLDPARPQPLSEASALIQFLLRLTIYDTRCKLQSLCNEQPVVLIPVADLGGEQAHLLGAGKQDHHRITWFELAAPSDAARISVGDAGGLGNYVLKVLGDPHLPVAFALPFKSDQPRPGRSNANRVPYHGTGRCDVVNVHNLASGRVLVAITQAGGPKSAVNIERTMMQTQVVHLLFPQFIDFNSEKIKAALLHQTQTAAHSPLLRMILTMDGSSTMQQRIAGGSSSSSCSDWLGASAGGLTEEQKTLVHRFVSDDNPLTILWGPPGTGKTTTIAHAIQAMMRKAPASRLLVTATTKDALKQIAKKLKEQYKLQCWGIDDVAAAQTESVGIPGSPMVVFLDPFDKTNALHKKCASSEAGVVILATPWQLHKIIDLPKRKPFDALVIDEASQMPVAHALIPSLLLNSETGRVLCAGDLLQLPPIIEAVDCCIVEAFGVTGESKRNTQGLSEIGRLLYSCRGSIMQALMRQKISQPPCNREVFSRMLEPGDAAGGTVPNNAVQLQISFRSVPAIVDFVAKRYPAGLRSPSTPVVRDHISLVERWSNQCLVVTWSKSEARDIGAMVSSFVANEANRNATIRVVTAHRRQRVSISAACSEACKQRLVNGEPQVAVDTTEKSQGAEADVVIMAMGDGVRYDATFAFNLYRLNVAISRAKYQVVVVTRSIDSFRSALQSATEGGGDVAACEGAKLMQDFLASASLLPMKEN